MHGLSSRAIHRRSSRLFALSCNENSTYTNNATGTLHKLFGLLGSQTEAPPRNRLQVLDEMFESHRNNKESVIAGNLKRMFQHEGGCIRLGPEWQGGRPKLVEWRPQTWDEIFDYYRSGVERALRLASIGEKGLELARDVIADATITLVRYRRWDDLCLALKSLSGGAWPKAIERLTWVLNYEFNNAPIRTGYLRRAC